MTGNDLLHQGITERILAAFYKVYNTLGFGFLEAVYSNAMAVELGRRGVVCKREVPVRVLYEGVLVGTYRFDMLVNGVVIVEVKSAAALGRADHKQVMNYLRASDLEVGLLLNFGPQLAFKRIVMSNPSKHRTEPGKPTRDPETNDPR
jgi:GxxExxY protein